MSSQTEQDNVKSLTPTEQQKTPTEAELPTLESVPPSQYQETMFMNSVVYNKFDYFEQMLSVCCHQSQRFVYDPKMDFSQFLSDVKQISPTLVVIGAVLSQEQLSQLLDKGFQQIRVFLYGETDSKKYNKGETEELFDNRVKCYTVDRLRECVQVENGYALDLLVEQITCVKFPQYKSHYNTKEHPFDFETGKQLLEAMLFTYEDFEAGVKDVMSNWWKGFPIYEELLSVGKVLTKVDVKVRSNIVSARYNSTKKDTSFKYNDETKTGVAVYCQDFITEMLNTLAYVLKQPDCKYNYGITFNLSCLKQDENDTVGRNGFHLAFVKNTDDTFKMTDMIKALCKSTVDIEEEKGQVYRCWMTMLDASLLLSFLR